MFKDNWLIGAGGGHGEPCFCIPVLPVLVHAIPCIFLQVAVETGIIGLIVLIMLLLSIVVQFITEYKYKKEEDVNYRILQGTLLTSIFGMFLHSCLDFDLSISSVFLLLWTLMALFNSGYRHNRPVVKEMTALVRSLVYFTG